MTGHPCAYPACPAIARTTAPMCNAHWHRVPARIRSAVWSATRRLANARDYGDAVASMRAKQFYDATIASAVMAARASVERAALGSAARTNNNAHKAIP